MRLITGAARLQETRGRSKWTTANWGNNLIGNLARLITTVSCVASATITSSAAPSIRDAIKSRGQHRHRIYNGRKYAVEAREMYIVHLLSRVSLALGTDARQRRSRVCYESRLPLPSLEIFASCARP